MRCECALGGFSSDTLTHTRLGGKGLMEYEDDRDFRDEENDLEDSSEQYDWRDYGEHKEADVSLQGKDYMAIFIASLQTIFLPLIILFILLFSMGFLISIFF